MRRTCSPPRTSTPDEPHTYMNCTSCDSSVPLKDEFCPQCPGDVPRALSLEKAEVPPAPQGEPLLDPVGAPVCLRHPLMSAKTCRQCSSFYCARCLPESAKQEMCARCS